MLRRMSHLAVLIAALSLGGCAANTLAFQIPLVAKASAQGGLVWRPGVWTAAEPGCAFDRGAPFDEWPDCSHAVIVGRQGAPDLYSHQTMRPLRFDERGQMVEAETASNPSWPAPRAIKWERPARWWRGETLRAWPGEDVLFGDHPATGDAQGAPTQVASAPRR